MEPIFIKYYFYKESFVPFMIYNREGESLIRQDLPPFKSFSAWRVVSAKVISLPSKEEEAEGVQDVDGTEEHSLESQELSQLSPRGEAPAPVACSSESNFSGPLLLSNNEKRTNSGSQWI